MMVVDAVSEALWPWADFVAADEFSEDGAQ
jgi:hypothetical protein